MRVSDEHLELMRRARPLDVPDEPCVGCSPEINGNEVTHAASCAISIDVDAVCDRDGDWFAAHPAADFFYRDVAWGEAANLILMGNLGIDVIPPNSQITPVGRVRVERFAEGVRIRRFEDIYFILGEQEGAHDRKIQE